MTREDFEKLEHEKKCEELLLAQYVKGLVHGSFVGGILSIAMMIIFTLILD